MMFHKLTFFLNHIFLFYFSMQPLQQFEWYGAPQGYHIKYRPVGCECSFSEAFVYDITANSHQLVDLQEYTLYEVTMVAVNDIGESALAPLAVERTRESGKPIFMHLIVYSVCPMNEVCIPYVGVSGVKGFSTQLPSQFLLSST